MIFLTFLAFLIVLAVHGSTIRESTRKRHLSAALKRLPPSSLLWQQRRLPKDDKPWVWGDKGMDMDCQFIEYGEKMNCTLEVGGVIYHLDEECSYDTSGGFESKMNCTICADESDADFQFCYKVGCDFLKIFEDLLGRTNWTMEQLEYMTEEERAELMNELLDGLSTSDIEGKACECVSAEVDNQACESCDLCAADAAESTDEEDEPIFTNLALNCPHIQHTHTSCEVIEQIRAGDLPEVEAPTKSGGGLSPGGKFGVAMLILFAVGGLVYVFAVRAQKRSIEAGQEQGHTAPTGVIT